MPSSTTERLSFRDALEAIRAAAATAAKADAVAKPARTAIAELDPFDWATRRELVAGSRAISAAVAAKELVLEALRQAIDSLDPDSPESLVMWNAYTHELRVQIHDWYENSDDPGNFNHHEVEDLIRMGEMALEGVPAKVAA